jgi:hypothetical protein
MARASERSRSPCSTANRAAIDPLPRWPTSAGGEAQVRSISSPSQPSTRSPSSSPSVTSDAPWPGRSGAMTRWVATSSGITRIHWPANAPGS